MRGDNLKVFGLIGEKLTHSLSPVIHNNLYQILNLNASYSLYQVKPDHLKAAIEGIKALDLSGVNVTIPYKVKVMQYLDEISAEAQKIGSVNTIHYNDAKLTGYNTDYFGFGRMLEKYNLNLAGKTTIVLGNGGAAKSVIAYLEDIGASQIVIIARNPRNASDYAQTHRVLDYTELSQIPHGDALINCTPVGMYPENNASPLSQAEVSKFKAVVDLVYNPFCTKLMSHAKDLGIPAFNGLYMLVAQAIAAVEIWIESKISDEVVDLIYYKLIEHLEVQKGKQ